MSASVQFRVQPFDTLFFGPPKAFPAGEAHHQRSQFPPSPMAFQGLIRTKLLAGVQPALDLSDRSGNAIRQRAMLVGEPDRLPSGWQLQGPYPLGPGAVDSWNDDAASAEMWLPLPRFVFGGEQGVKQRGRLLNPVHPGRDDRDKQVGLVGVPKLDKAKPLDGWVSASNLLWALTGQGEWTPSGYCKDHPPFVKFETHTGIEVDPRTGVAMDQKLYSLEVLRLAPGASFWGRITVPDGTEISIDALTEGTGTAGRGGRLVQFSRVQSLHPSWNQLLQGVHIGEKVNDGDRFWLLTLSPAAIPGDKVEKPLAARLGGAQIQFESALLGKPIRLGGMSMVHGRSRPNQLYVPAGSCWLFSVHGGTPEERGALVQRLHNAHPLGALEEGQFGFGHTLVGLYSESLRRFQ